MAACGARHGRGGGGRARVGCGRGAGAALALGGQELPKGHLCKPPPPPGFRSRCRTCVCTPCSRQGPSRQAGASVIRLPAGPGPGPTRPGPGPTGPDELLRPARPAPAARTSARACCSTIALQLLATIYIPSAVFVPEASACGTSGSCSQVARRCTAALYNASSTSTTRLLFVML